MVVVVVVVVVMVMVVVVVVVGLGWILLPSSLGHVGVDRGQYQRRESITNVAPPRPPPRPTPLHTSLTPIVDIH